MDDKILRYKEIYRVESNRLQGWDYAGNGHYFITLVTQHRTCHLGYIKNEKMYLSEFGKIIESEWIKSFNIRHELFLEEWIIMPNHIHAIIQLIQLDGIGVVPKTTVDEDCENPVETHGRVSLQQYSLTQSLNPKISQDDPPFPAHENNLHRLPRSLSSFIAGFKSSVNSKIDNYIDTHELEMVKFNRNNPFFQRNYYDHIIQNPADYENTKYYIQNNVKNWKDDELFKASD